MLVEVIERTQRFVGPTIVVGCCVLMSSVVYYYSMLVFPLYFSSAGIVSIAHGLMALTMALNMFYNYYKAVASTPGYVPIAENSADLVEEGRWCRVCKLNKPARAHHCSVCQRCVYRMDHHCPWVNNCVGFYNHRYFVLYLFWIGLFAAYIAVMTWPLVAGSVEHLRETPTERNIILVLYRKELVFEFVWCTGVAVTILGYCAWHMFLVCTQQTTVEYYHNKTEKRRLGPAFTNPYDRGILDNFEEFFDMHNKYLVLRCGYLLCPGVVLPVTAYTTTPLDN